MFSDMADDSSIEIRYWNGNFYQRSMKKATITKMM